MPNGRNEMTGSTSGKFPLTRYAWLSIGAALTTIALKGLAYHITGSVGLLSDILESTVNLTSAVVALIVLSVADRPANEEFTFGFSKVEYFSSGFEGGMIVLAAIGIIITAVPRLINPVPLEQVGLGLAVSVLASLINLGVAIELIRVGREHNSITLEADGKHLMTDVWTTAGVLVGVGLVWLTGYARLDAVIALLVAANIIYTGYRLLLHSGRGLLDVAISPEELDKVREALDSFAERGVSYHALRTRQAAARRFLDVHLLVPGHWTVKQGHDLAEEVETKIRGLIPNASITTHVEPLGDPLSRRHDGVDLV